MDRNLSAYHGQPEKHGLLAPAGLLVAAALVVGIAFVAAEFADGSETGGTNLVIASIATGLILLAPTYYEYRKGRFDLFHPLTFAAWSYLLPAFCVGGLILALGLNRPFFLSFIENPENTLPLSLAYVSLGFAGTVAGFYLPWSTRIAAFIDRRLPGWEWRSPGVWFAGLLLLLMGVGLNILGFVSGLLGFQRVDRIGDFDAVIVFFALFFFEGIILLWLAFFRQDMEKPLVTYLLLVFLIGLIPLRSVLFGSRGELLGAAISIAMAYWYSGRRIRKAYVFLFGALMVASLTVGVVWATTFRSIKGSETRINSGDYVGQLKATADYLLAEDFSVVLTTNALALMERIETVSSLGVSVSNYEKLAPYEEAYGLDNNIMRDAATAVVPRFLWADKPGVSDPRAYADLYFNYSDNSFAVTPFADLLRNFGPMGVFFGMMVVGFYLCIIYRVLILTENRTIWKTMAYLPLLLVISYEGFYSVYVASILRVVFVIVASVLLVQFLFGRMGARR